jgi:hypothetical protein
MPLERRTVVRLACDVCHQPVTRWFSSWAQQELIQEAQRDGHDVSTRPGNWTGTQNALVVTCTTCREIMAQKASRFTVVR